MSHRLEELLQRTRGVSEMVKDSGWDANGTPTEHQCGSKLVIPSGPMVVCTKLDHAESIKHSGSDEHGRYWDWEPGGLVHVNSVPYTSAADQFPAVKALDSKVGKPVIFHPDSTLRDQFAAAAMRGLPLMLGVTPGSEGARLVARAAFIYADAMLEARKR